ncbi:YggS family pyridoxal phosphate-dependent enzyme [Acidiluteibacter ferrifornacis]|uniref:Pyridoxal phosphate homeostasis protein n=1 Tax=Acidiluteibacter ferrifornacis TaxID=2692424 RepID=A0A6N9NJD8_9FLAO|nr:YggS family pyridoxal phosphate-dependent enzyme [Acidiluteibacter ferrifornacis]NBG65310.1 YggS family pyridoxal phosphate-dependent enzyme [Acidiluteibacter ferrifornacis]
MSIAENLSFYKEEVGPEVTLVAVSKTKPNEDILAAYAAGQRIFGENKAQEMTTKYEALPKDIEWHMIGHLQRNKVKYIAPYVSLIHSVDSLRLLKEINKEAQKNNRTIPCLLQVYIAKEESKFGLDETEVVELLDNHLLELPNIKIVGLMGMATNTDNEATIKNEFISLNVFFNRLKQTHFSNDQGFQVLSMGMSGDYSLAISCGSNMVRIGSAIFGSRNYIN